MKIIHKFEEIVKEGTLSPPIGITIGNFDGFHLGHQSLIKKIKSDCEKSGLKLLLITFNPHPQKILHPDREKFLITSYEKKKKLIENYGVDYYLELNFTRDFSTLSAEQFMQDYIFIYPNIRTIYLGYDFAFGANKHGGHDLVKNICENKGVNVEIQPKYEFEGQTLSSSLIRSKLQNGEMDIVTNLLGHLYQLEGVVVKGEGRGKKIGFPTANIQSATDLIIPQKGVYITRTHYKDMTFESITNIGNNPTFKDSDLLSVETNIFDFDVDIYGEKIDIEFLKKIRDEKKFQTVNDLISQIKSDIDFTKKYFQKI